MNLLKPGGNWNAYNYPLDPVNFSDLSGLCFLQCAEGVSYYQPAAPITYYQATISVSQIQHYYAQTVTIRIAPAPRALHYTGSPVGPIASVPAAAVVVGSLANAKSVWNNIQANGFKPLTGYKGGGIYQNSEFPNTI